MKGRLGAHLLIVFSFLLITLTYSGEIILQNGTKYNGLEYRGCEDTFVRCFGLDKKHINDNFHDSSYIYVSHDKD